MIQSPIVNDYIKSKLYGENRGTNTELHKKMLLQVYICELHIDIIKKDATGFYIK